MPVHYRIDKERRLIVATVFDEVSIAEMIDAISDSVSDPDFERGFNVLSDHTRITRVIIPEHVKRIVDHLESLSIQLSGARWAVVTESEASFGMMRMMSVLAERVPMEVQVFRNADEAGLWLDSTDG
jgi:hypothetical protein